MSTKVEQPKEQRAKTDKIRLIAQVMTEPEEKTSKAGNSFFSFKAVVNDGVTEQGTWWNMTMMAPLMSKMKEIGADAVLAKFGYAKFIGVPQHRPWQGKDGETRISHEMLINAVELQNKTYVKPDDSRGDSENKDEDAPF